MKMLISFLLLMSFAVHANECVDLTKCIEYISKITGKKYLYDNHGVKGGLQATTNFQLTADNADNLFTYILDMNGYSRIPTAEKDTFIIVNSRDIRYQAVPMINVDAQTPPKIASNYDFYMMNYQFKHHNHNQPRQAANYLRPFMSRYARVIELKVSGTITIQENAAQLAKAYEIIKMCDRELTKEEIKKEEECEKEEKEERKLERKFEHKEMHNKKEEIKEQTKEVSSKDRGFSD